PAAGVLHQLIDDVDTGYVARHTHFCPHSEAIDGRSGFKQFRDHVFVEVSTGEDSHLLQAGLVENLPRGDAEARQIAGIQTNRTHLEIRSELACQSHDLSN